MAQQEVARKGRCEAKFGKCPSGEDSLKESAVTDDELDTTVDNVTKSYTSAIDEMQQDTVLLQKTTATKNFDTSGDDISKFSASATDNPSSYSQDVLEQSIVTDEFTFTFNDFLKFSTSATDDFVESAISQYQTLIKRMKDLVSEVRTANEAEDLLISKCDAYTKSIEDAISEVRATKRAIRVTPGSVPRLPRRLIINNVEVPKKFPKRGRQILMDLIYSSDEINALKPVVTKQYEEIQTLLSSWIAVGPETWKHNKQCLHKVPLVEKYDYNARYYRTLIEIVTSTTLRLVKFFKSAMGEKFMGTPLSTALNLDQPCGLEQLERYYQTLREMRSRGTTFKTVKKMVEQMEKEKRMESGGVTGGRMMTYTDPEGATLTLFRQLRSLATPHGGVS